MIKNFKIFEANKYKHSMSVKSVYDKCDNDPVLVVEELKKIFKGKAINIRDKNGDILFGSNVVVKSFHHATGIGGGYYLILNETDDIYSSDFIIWNEPIIKVNELDPYGEEDWDEEVENLETFEKFNQSEDIIENIKTYLINDNEYDTWEEFVDSQQMGDCQGIVASIIYEFPQAEKVFGGIELDEPMYDWDNEGQEEYNITHHWVIINGSIYDFSKGTLRGYVEMDDYELYEPEVIDDWRYKTIDEWRKTKINESNNVNLSYFIVDDIFRECNEDIEDTLNALKRILLGKKVKIFEKIKGEYINFDKKDNIWYGPVFSIEIYNPDNCSFDLYVNDGNIIEVTSTDKIFYKEPTIIINDRDPYGEEDWDDEI
jgi:hypothetical protein